MKFSLKTLRAGQVTIALIGAIIIMLFILIAGSALAATRLLSESKDVTHARIDSDVSATDATRLEALKQYLAKNATGISQTADLTAGLGKYDQNQIVATINGYAAKAGVTITSFDFGTSASAAAGTSGAATATAANNGTVNLTLGSPLQYKNFIVFLKLLEQGLMPAQVMSAQISADVDNPGNIVLTAFSVKVAQ